MSIIYCLVEILKGDFLANQIRYRWPENQPRLTMFDLWSKLHFYINSAQLLFLTYTHRFLWNERSFRFSNIFLNFLIMHFLRNRF